MGILSWKKLAAFKEFVSGRVFNLLLLSSFVGFCLFLIESSFVFVLQGFLFAIGILEPGKLSLPSWYPRSLSWAIILLIAFGSLRAVVFFLRAYLAGMCQQAFVRMQRSRILSYGLAHASRVSSHEVINLFSERVVQAGAVVSVISQLLLMLTSAFFLVFLGFRLAPIEMVIGIILLSVCLFPLRYINHRIRASAVGLVQESERATKLLVQGFRHNFFLKIYGLLGKETESGLSSLKAAESHYNRYYLVYSFKGTLPLLLGMYIICAITYASVFYIHTAPTSLLGFFYIFIRLAQTLGEINTALSEIRLNWPGLRIVHSWQERFGSDREAFRPAVLSPRLASGSEDILRELKESGLKLGVEKLGFRYGDGNFLFRDLNFRLGRGDVLVVRGKSGTGKSTLLNVLLGLSEASEGEVTVNGLPVLESLPWLSPRIAYVGPDPHLIAGTVRENLLYGHTDPAAVSEEDFWDALSRAQLRNEIASLSRGLDEPLLESTQLSTGQRQRLAIARGLLRKPDLFILDEASANLDSATERDFIDSLQTILGGIVTIVISHKDTFDSLATMRLNMDRGAIG